MVVRAAFSKMESPGLVRERRERFLVRRRYLEESIAVGGIEEAKDNKAMVESTELEEVADEAEKKFWSSQGSPNGVVAAGKGIIGLAHEKKNQ